MLSDWTPHIPTQFYHHSHGDEIAFMITVKLHILLFINGVKCRINRLGNLSHLDRELKSDTKVQIGLSDAENYYINPVPFLKSPLILLRIL